MSNQFQTREDWLAQAIAELRSVFSALNHPLPDSIRVACGFPSSNARSAKNRAVGEHWSAKASSDNTHEILISPVIDDPVRVLGILVHELAHASTDGDGHKGRFPALVKALSLEGKPTATVEGEKFKAEYQPLLDDLGAYPHAKLNAGDEPQSARHSDAQGLLPMLRVYREAFCQVGQHWSARMPSGWH
jgi:hypothetical protein